MEEQQRLKIFISYSRRDVDFADRLVAALDARGFDVLIDRRNLPKLEDWERELVGFIRAADTVVFVVSPASVASPVCVWEVGQVRLYSKRLAPVVIADVDGAPVPAEISRINFIFFTGNAPFDERVDGLARALNTDIGWLKEHTRLGELAQRWIERGRPDEELIVAKDLEEADAWAARRPREAPVVSEEQLEFLTASHAGQVSRLKKEQQQIVRTTRLQKRAAWALSGVAGLIVLGMIAAAMQTRSASEQTSRVLTSLADTEIQRGYYDRAMRIALQGLSPAGAVPWLSPSSSDLEAKLSGAAMASRLKAQLNGHTGAITWADFSPDGNHILSASADGTARMWSVRGDGAGTILAGHTGPVLNATYGSDGARIVTASQDKTARLWDATTATLIGTPLTGHGDVVNRASFSPDGARIVTSSYDQTARLWDGLTGALIAVLKGHQGIIADAAFSPDGARIATASHDGTVKLWDGRLGTQIGLLQRTSPGPVDGVTFSADGTRLLIISIVQSVGYREAQLWDTQRGKVVTTLDGVNSAVFSPDSARVVITSDEKAVQLIDARNGKKLAALIGHDSAVNCATFSPDGARIVTGSYDRTARLWDGKSGKPIGEPLRGHQGKVSAAIFSPDGTRILTASDDDTARLWDAQSGTEIATFRGHIGRSITTAKFSPDGSLVLTVGDDNTIRVWEARRGTELAVLRSDQAVQAIKISPQGSRALVWSFGSQAVAQLVDTESGTMMAALNSRSAIRSVAFSPDGSRIAIASDDNTARLWDAVQGTEITTFRGRNGRELKAKFDRASVLLLANSDGKTIRVWEAESGRGIDVLTTATSGLQGTVFSPDGTRVLGWSIEGSVARLWDIGSGTQIAALPFEGEGLQSAAFSGDGERILTISHDGKLRVWDGRRGTLISVLSGDVHPFDKATFSPDAARVLTWSEGVDSAPALVLWDATSGAPVGAPLRGHHGTLRGASFSPDGKRILTASDDKTAQLWDGQNGTVIGVLGHEGEVHRAAFSPNGARIVSASDDATVRVWDGRSGTAIITLRGHEKSVGNAQFSADGARLLTSSDDHTTRIWNIALLTKDAGLQLRNRVCSEKLVGARAFTVEDVRDPILQGLAGTDPCERRGPLSGDFWFGVGDNARSFVGRLFRTFGSH